MTHQKIQELVQENERLRGEARLHYVTITQMQQQLRQREMRIEELEKFGKALGAMQEFVGLLIQPHLGVALNTRDEILIKRR